MKFFFEQNSGYFAHAAGDVEFAEAGAKIFADRRLIGGDVGTFVSINRPSGEVLCDFKQDGLTNSGALLIYAARIT